MKKITITLDDNIIDFMDKEKKDFGTPYSVTVRRAMLLRIGEPTAELTPKALKKAVKALKSATPVEAPVLEVPKDDMKTVGEVERKTIGDPNKLPEWYKSTK